MTIVLAKPMGSTLAKPTGPALAVDELLAELRRRKWTLYRWGPPDTPVLLAAIYRWEHVTDVLILRGEDDASAYRVPAEPYDERIWNPRRVYYQYHATALRTLRAILTIPEPDGRTCDPETAASPCAIPDDLPRPAIIRPL